MDILTVDELSKKVSDSKIFCYTPADPTDKRQYRIDRAKESIEKRLIDFNNAIKGLQPVGIDYVLNTMETLKAIIVSGIKPDAMGLQEIYFMVADINVQEVVKHQDEILKKNQSQMMGLRAGSRLLLPGQNLKVVKN